MSGIIITRPLIQGVSTAQKLQNIGHKTFLLPLLAIEEQEFSIEDLRDWSGAVVITSRNALAALHKIQSQLKISRIYTIGPTNLGPKTINSRDIKHLLELLKLNAEKSILYLRGDHITCNIKLHLKHCAVNERVVYKSIDIGAKAITLINSADEIHLNDYNSIMFYSSRAAIIMSRIASKINLNLQQMQAIAISSKVADILAPLQFAKIIIAEQPNELGMIQMLHNFPQPQNI